jgi:S-methylmethionine-dependent homocysteine/selenocysteine methylase
MSKLVLDREGNGGNGGSVQNLAGREYTGGGLCFRQGTHVLAGPYGTELKKLIGDRPELSEAQMDTLRLEIASKYVDAGADTVLADSFGLRNLINNSAALETLEHQFQGRINVLNLLIDIYGSQIKLAGASLGPFGDCYKPEQGPKSIAEAQEFHEEQAKFVGRIFSQHPRAWFETFNNKTDALGAVLAAKRLGVDTSLSFVLGTDGNLLSSESLEATIREIDTKTGNYAKAFGLNCCTFDAAQKALASIKDPKILARIQIIYPNAAKEESHSNLENSDQVIGLAGEQAIAEYRRLITLQRKYPNLKVVGGCCGYNPSNIKDLRALVGGATRQVTVF